MSIGDLQGRARTSARNPIAKGECDRCRRWYVLDALQRQFEWRGASLADTGFLVCRPCLDVPQEQYRVLILPGDPIPRVNPRPSPDVTGFATAGNPAVPTNPENLGFSQYVLGSPAFGDYPNPMTGFPRSTSDAAGKAQVLAQVAQLSSIPVPTQALDYGTIVEQQNVSQLLLDPQPMRNWLLFYNPSNPPVQVALSDQGFWGMATNLAVGPGEAYFWSSLQGLGNAWAGSLSLIGLYPGMPFWIWQSPDPLQILLDGYGKPILDGYGHWIPL